MNHNTVYDELLDEWNCPICGRRIKFNPFTVLERGDENATHSGGTNGLSIGATVTQHDPRLQPFEEWASKHIDF